MDQEPDRSEAFFQRWFSTKEAADAYAAELDDGEGPPPRTEVTRDREGGWNVWIWSD